MNDEWLNNVIHFWIMSFHPSSPPPSPPPHQLFFNFFQLEKVEKSWKVEKVEKSRKSLLLFSHSLLYYWVNDEWLKNTIHLLNHVFSSFVSTSVAASACMLSSKKVCEKNWKKSPPSSTVTHLWWQPFFGPWPLKKDLKYLPNHHHSPPHSIYSAR